MANVWTCFPLQAERWPGTLPNWPECGERCLCCALPLRCWVCQLWLAHICCSQKQRPPRPRAHLQDEAARWQSLGTGSLQSNLLSVQLLGSLPAGLSLKVGRMQYWRAVTSVAVHNVYTMI